MCPMKSELWAWGINLTKLPTNGLRSMILSLSKQAQYWYLNKKMVGLLICGKKGQSIATSLMWYGKSINSKQQLSSKIQDNVSEGDCGIWKKCSSLGMWIFTSFCPVWIRAMPRKIPRAGHQALLTRGMNVHAQINLIDYQSMPDGLLQCVFDYQDHDIKFCQFTCFDTENTWSHCNLVDKQFLHLWPSVHPASW